MKVNSIYKHIDNGGVTVEVHRTDDEYKNLYISFNTSYFGYPDITSVLHLWGNLGSDFLKELGAMFIEAAEIAKQKQKIEKINAEIGMGAEAK